MTGPNLLPEDSAPAAPRRSNAKWIVGATTLVVAAGLINAQFTPKPLDARLRSNQFAASVCSPRALHECTLYRGTTTGTAAYPATDIAPWVACAEQIAVVSESCRQPDPVAQARCSALSGVFLTSAGRPAPAGSPALLYGESDLRCSEGRERYGPSD